jgi:hypothetical protein
MTYRTDNTTGKFPWEYLAPSQKSSDTFFYQAQRERERVYTMTETPEQAAAAAQEKDTYLYEEEYRPWFVWALILAPCLMPPVWYVPDRNLSQRRYRTTNLIVLASVSQRYPLSHPVSLSFTTMTQEISCTCNRRNAKLWVFCKLC